MIQYLYLGRVDYGEALRLAAGIGRAAPGRPHRQRALAARASAGAHARPQRKPIQHSRLGRAFGARGVTLHEINRGGDVTYHGPGQLIGYPIFDLRSLRNPNGKRLGPVDFVRLMEEALIRLCGEFGVQAGRICGLTGVWCHLRWGSPLDESCGDESQRSARRESAKSPPSEFMLLAA